MSLYIAVLLIIAVAAAYLENEERLGAVHVF